MTINVLLVERDNILRGMITTFLEEKGFGVISAKNGLEGLEAYQKNQETINGVLCSQQVMPMFGDQMVEEIRKHESMNSLPEKPIVVMTGGCSNEVHDKFYKLGVKEIMQKPFLPEELIAKVQKYFS